MEVNKKEQLYKRSITHQDYLGNSDVLRNSGGPDLLQHHITEKKVKFDQNELDRKDIFEKLTDNYIIDHVASYVLPQMLGGTCLVFFLGFFFITYTSTSKEPIPTYAYIVMVLSLLGVIFSIYYYFTMPKKECVFNREDGLLTLPGAMWNPNTTMPIKKVMFVYTGPSAQGTGAYKLQVMRPDKFYSRYLLSLGNTCYEDLSFFLWYMDKNRPLPPGTAFDPYREKDYARRKAAGFPIPLFDASFDTPEATPEQQAERKRIGGW